MGRSHHYHVYVVELSKDVLYKARFKKANPDYVAGKPCPTTPRAIWKSSWRLICAKRGMGFGRREQDAIKAVCLEVGALNLGCL